MFESRYQNAKGIMATLSLWLLVCAGTVGLLIGGIWAGLGIGFSVVIAMAYGVLYKAFPWPSRPITYVACAFLFAAILSVFSSTDMQDTAYHTLKLSSVLLPLLFLFSPQIQAQCRLSSPDIHKVGLALFFGLFMHSMYLCFAVTYYDQNAAEITKMYRALSYGSMLALPLLAALFLQKNSSKIEKRFRLVFLATLLFSLLITYSRANQMGAVLAVMAFLLARFWPRLTMGLLGFGSLLTIGWPLWANLAFSQAYAWVRMLPASWQHRVEIWDYLSYRIVESPLFGHGIGQTHKLDWVSPHGALYTRMTKAASHSHNAAVQAWVEMGAVGIVAYVLAIGLALWGITKLQPAQRTWGVAAFVFTFQLLLSAYNFWTDSLWAAMAIMVFAFIILRPEKAKN